MKAVGMRVTDIRRIYLAVYGFLAAAGSAAGFLLSILLLKPLREGIRLNLGDGGGGASSLLAGLAGAALVFLLILLYVNWNLRRFHQISAVQAIRFGCRTGASDGFRVVRLSNKSRCSVNFLLAINDVLARKRLYATMLFVIMLSSFIMIVPQNLYHTISGEDFVTYIGVGDCDLRLDIRQTGQIEDKTAEVGAFMREDPEIADYALFVSKTYQIRTEDGAAENLKVELGEHTAFPLRYASGTMPAKESDIALSALNAKELGKNIGDTIILLSPDGERSLTVCGIYSDITNGGKTAKAAFADRSKEAEWSIVCANLADKSMLSRINLKYSKKFPYAKISGIDEYMAQTFGQTLRSVRSASLSCRPVGGGNHPAGDPAVYEAFSGKRPVFHFRTAGHRLYPIRYRPPVCVASGICSEHRDYLGNRVGRNSWGKSGCRRDILIRSRNLPVYSRSAIHLFSFPADSASHRSVSGGTGHIPCGRRQII